MKLKHYLSISLLISGTLLCFKLNATVHAMHQKQAGLSHYNIKQYRVLNNIDHYLPAYPFRQTSSYQQSVFQTLPDHLTAIPNQSQTNASFTTQYFLPVSYQRSSDLANPQSAVIVDQYAYIMYTLTGGSKYGFVVKYDLNRLNQLHANQPGQMDQFRHATWNHNAHQLNNYNRKFLKAMQVGPSFNTGHGQSLAYNSKTHEMWFVLKTGIHAAVQKLNMHTLRPENKINFKLSSTVPMGENLIFDKDGHAYFYSYASGGWAPKGSVKLYRGAITDHHVHFNLIMQGIRHAPGPIDQFLGYNPVQNKLYLVANGSITSLPINNLGHLTKHDVKTTNFNQAREFEALAFDSNGNGYLLVNRGPELMKLNGDL